MYEELANESDISGESGWAGPLLNATVDFVGYYRRVGTVWDSRSLSALFQIYLSWWRAMIVSDIIASCGERIESRRQMRSPGETLEGGGRTSENHSNAWDKGTQNSTTGGGWRVEGGSTKCCNLGNPALGLEQSLKKKKLEWIPFSRLIHI